MAFPTRFKKVIALTFAFIILNNIISPTIAWALTSGPNRPESTSFEPVDTTDMVNLLSGDLAYNIPLLEVPGPEGGYPLSLSYHAGQMPEIESSWVGLGWTLNPGAIDRQVSGFPDDFNGAGVTKRDYWPGGVTQSTSVGVSFPLAGVVGANLGITVAHDTYRGSGVGFSAGISISPSNLANIGGSHVGLAGAIGISTDPFTGDLSVNGGVDASYGKAIAKGGGSVTRAMGSLGLNFSSNFSSFNVGASAGLGLSEQSKVKDANNKSHTTFKGGGSLLGASISSNGRGGALTIAGERTSVENVNKGQIQTKSSSWGFSTPTIFGFGFSISHTYMRYWSDTHTDVSTYGTLFYPQMSRVSGGTNQYDTFYLPDISDPNYSLTTTADPVTTAGGTLPDYDSYSVAGQGISGNIRPYGYQLAVEGKAENELASYKTNLDYTVTTYPNNTPTTTNYPMQNPYKLFFRFTGDFSNRYTQNDIQTSATDDILKFDTNPVYGLNDGTYGYDPNSSKLASATNVEYFTNDDIKNGYAQINGFIDTHAAGFNRAVNPDGSPITGSDTRIGGFMITNESGVTYHYALPVYSYNEFSKTMNTKGVDVSGDGQTQYTYETEVKNMPYATTWILTAITGPDYVDANHDGKVDQGDWGYGVSFEYGKWAHDYAWRTPYAGWIKDIDQNFQDYATGLKELYYLDAVVTPTHTALFSKEMRADGKGAVKDNSDNTDPAHGTQSLYPTPQLRLDDIILYNNTDLMAVTNTTTVSDAINNIRAKAGYNTFTQTDPNCSSASSGCSLYTTYLGNNVIDKFDIAAISGFNNKILRDIQMNYDYSLCPNTTNSFDQTGTAYTNGQTFSYSNYATLGKLTLKGVSFLGKQAQASIPATTFDYELPTDLVKQASNIAYNGQVGSTHVYTFQDPNSVFSQGDLIMFAVGHTTYYGLVKQVDAGNIIEVFIGSPPAFATGSTYAFTSTKNPPYNQDTYDMWGMYKADYISTGNRNMDRMPTAASAKASDVWSLRRIHQALGMTTDIVYEPDSYGKVALYTNPPILIKGVTDNGNNTITFTTSLPPDYASFINVGDKVRISLFGTAHTISNTSPASIPMSISSGDKPTLTITAVTTNATAKTISFTITDPSFYYQVYSLTSFYNGGAYKNDAFTFGSLWPGNFAGTYGGGLRVSKVINKEPITGVSMQVGYNYNVPGTPGLSSGTTSYEPLGVDVLTMATAGVPSNLAASLTKDYSNLLGLSRILPGPGIMYEYVSVAVSRTADAQTVQQLGSTQYQFEVFNKGMVGVDNQHHDSGGTKLRNIMIQNYTSRVGNLKRVIKYDNNNNKLSETINSYLNDQQSSESIDGNRSQYNALLSNSFSNQGLIVERTAEGRSNGGKTYLLTTTKAEYPNVPIGSTTIDYKTGQKTTSQTLAFDFYSGSPTAVLTFDSYGNRFKAVTKPAYSVYPQMGLRSMNIANANMLTQSAGDITYAVDANNNPTGVASATATVWSNQTNMLNDAEQPVNTLNANTYYPPNSGSSQTTLNIWRPFQVFDWMPQDRTAGITQAANFSPFNYTATSQVSPWTLSTQITLYNKYSAALEGFDINGNYSSTKMGYNMSKVVAGASNSNYSEMTYAGLEDGVLSGTALARGINLGGASIVAGISHTGNNSAQLNGGQSGLHYSVNTNSLRAGRNYTASVWVQTSGTPANATLYYKINGGTAQLAIVNSAKSAGSWTLVTLQIPGSAIPANGTLEVGCTNTGTSIAYFDDFRFKPMNSSMTSYVYDPSSGELLFILDGNNLFTQFQYDIEGRLTNTYKETIGYGVKLVSQIKYNYGTH